MTHEFCITTYQLIGYFSLLRPSSSPRNSETSLTNRGEWRGERGIEIRRAKRELADASDFFENIKESLLPDLNFARGWVLSAKDLIPAVEGANNFRLL